MGKQHLTGLTLATTVHNNAEMSKAMLKSFVEHIGGCEEIVIVDDGSNDPFIPPSIDIPVRVLRNDTATGFCHASDRALRAVKTDFALLVDADVLFLEGDLLGAYKEFAADSLWSFVNFIQMDFNGHPQGSFEIKQPPAWVFGMGNQVRTIWEKITSNTTLKPGNSCRIADVEIAHSSCALVRIPAYLEIGGFDKWYWQCESDVDLSLSFIKGGYRVGIDTGYTLMHAGIGGKTGSDKRTLDLYRARLHLYEKFDSLARLYLRPLLFMRHLIELVFFTLCGRESQLRQSLLKTVWQGYE